MDMNNDSFKQMVFDLARGSWNLQEYPVEESEIVKNEFADGALCDKAYEQVFNANQSLCYRLGVREDEDVECIISNLLDISKHLCMKMYDYGEYFALRKEDDNPNKKNS